MVPRRSAAPRTRRCAGSSSAPRPARRPDRGPRPRARNYDAVTELVAARLKASQGRMSAKRLLPIARAAGYAGSPRNFRRLVAEQKALWRRDHHRGRRPAVWAPGEYLVIDWATVGAGLHLFCAVLAWSRWRFVAFARTENQSCLARYLRQRDLQREINEGLNIVESWNRANSVIFFGKGGDIATNRRDEQELSVLCLQVLQTALVYVNTLMIQDVLADDAWLTALTNEDRRALTPVFWAHVAPLRRGQTRHARRLTLNTPND